MARRFFPDCSPREPLHRRQGIDRRSDHGTRSRSASRVGVCRARSRVRAVLWFSRWGGALVRRWAGVRRVQCGERLVPGGAVRGTRGRCGGHGGGGRAPAVVPGRGQRRTRGRAPVRDLPPGAGGARARTGNRESYPERRRSPVDAIGVAAAPFLSAVPRSSVTPRIVAGRESARVASSNHLAVEGRSVRFS